jgi:hypothetical protein
MRIGTYVRVPLGSSTPYNVDRQPRKDPLRAP